MPFVVHGSRVYQYRSKNNWKESWLSLEETGSLNWKRKDAFLPLASVRLSDIVDRIKIGDAWHENKEESEPNRIRPFFLFIPMRVDRSATRFAFMHGPDLELWLSA